MKTNIGIIKDSQNIAFVIDPEDFNEVSYKVMQNNLENQMLRCTKLSHNGKVKLLYDIQGCKVLEQIITQLDYHRMLLFEEQILNLAITIKNNGFMNPECLYIHMDDIYVDTKTYLPKLIYAPLKEKMEHGGERLFDVNVKALLLLITRVCCFDIQKLDYLIFKLEETSCTLEKYKELIEDELRVLK